MCSQRKVLDTGAQKEENVWCSKIRKDAHTTLGKGLYVGPHVYMHDRAAGTWCNGANQLANARSKRSDRPSALHLRHTKIPRTLRSRSVRISSLSASKKGLAANLSTKKDFSLAKRDFLVANGQMAADFSSPGKFEQFFWFFECQNPVDCLSLFLTFFPLLVAVPNSFSNRTQSWPLT